MLLVETQASRSECQIRSTVMLPQDSAEYFQMVVEGVRQEGKY